MSHLGLSTPLSNNVDGLKALIMVGGLITHSQVGRTGSLSYQENEMNTILSVLASFIQIIATLISLVFQWKVSLLV